MLVILKERRGFKIQSKFESEKDNKRFKKCFAAGKLAHYWRKQSSQKFQ